MKLEKILDRFAESHGNVEVNPTPVNIKPAFATKEGYDAPNMFGNLNEGNDVVAYIARGEAFINKFEQSESQVHRIRSVKDDIDYQALSCLCVYHIRNVSLYEVQHGLQVSDDDAVLGFSQKHVQRIETLLQEYDPGFDKEKDSAFIFASSNKAEERARLNAKWFEDILEFGSGATSVMSNEECRLMEKVFPPEVLTGEEIRQYSYMPYRDNLPTQPSQTYLQRKVNSYQNYRA